MTSSPTFGLFQSDGITVFRSQDTPLMRALAGESCDGVEIFVRSSAHPHGVLLTVRGRPLSTGAGDPGAVAVYRDVTNERAQRTELEMFAAVAAHDLSAPLDTPTPAFVVGAIPWVHGDRARIAQVLNNLIGNALKYTVAGQPAHIEITAHLTTPEEGAEPQVTVQVSDRGIGIPAGHHAAIFTNLHRAHLSGAYSGTGLGLAICARIIERHGGHIHATDNPGGGTRIHFTLPRAHRSHGDPSGESVECSVEPD